MRPSGTGNAARETRGRQVARTTLIRNASWVVGWNREDRRHVYLRDADIAFEGDRITFVGSGFEGPAEVVVDGRDRFVMPGLIDLHSHLAEEPLGKGVVEESGSRKLFNTGLYEYMLLDPDRDAMRAARRTAIAELLRSGCTTVVDLQRPPDPEWAETVAPTGIRAFLAAGYRSARWHAPSDHDVRWEWDEKAGERGLDSALAEIERVRRHPSGRLDGMLSPSQVDTVSEDLWRRTVAVARERGLLIHTHASQSVVEFLEMTRRHGETPLGFLADLGALGPRTIIGHAIFTDQHPWIRWPERRDLGLLAETGTTVAHCPLVFARRGMMVVSFGAYRRAGINLGLGTDTFPFNMLDEMRWAIMIGKVASEDVIGARAAEVFDSATTGGAKALGREDLGRLAPGAKADLVLVDLTHPSMRPLRDPVMSLLYSALERPVREVYVDGRVVVRDGDLGGLGLRRGIAPTPVRRTVAQTVQMAVRQPRQALEAPIAKELVLTLHHPPGARATHPAQLLVNLGKQTDVRCGVALLERARRTAATVLDAPGLAVLTDQPRRVRPRPPRDLGDKATHDPLVRLAQLAVVQPPQRACDEVVGAAPVREVKVDRLAAGQEVAHLLEGAQPFDVESQDHPPMIPTPPRSGSCLMGQDSRL